jgi:hypothetical protein
MNLTGVELAGFASRVAGACVLMSLTMWGYREELPGDPGGERQVLLLECPWKLPTKVIDTIQWIDIAYQRKQQNVGFSLLHRLAHARPIIYDGVNFFNELAALVSASYYRLVEESLFPPPPQRSPRLLPCFALSAKPIVLSDQNLHLAYIYIYIYIYVCVCVCVCVCVRYSSSNHELVRLVLFRPVQLGTARSHCSLDRTIWAALLAAWIWAGPQSLSSSSKRLIR